MGSSLRKGVVTILAPPHIAAHLVTEAVVVVTRVAHRKQVAVLGVQYEQQAVEDDQGGVAHLSERRVRRLVSDGASEFREDTAEYQIGQVGGDPLLVETAFVEHSLMEGTRVGRPGKKGFTTKEQYVQLQPMAALGLGEREEAIVVAGKIEDGRQVDFEELLRRRTGRPGSRDASGRRW